MKKFLACALSVMLLLTGCAKKQNVFQAGTYTAISENGKNGNVEVKVEFETDEIKSIEITSHQETPGLSDKAINEFPQLIVDEQSIKVDAFSGATITCDAILEAVIDCVKQAGGEAGLKYLSGEKDAVKKEVVELEKELVIVGGGATGMAAAISSAQNGAKDVLVLEKMSQVGGNAMVSGGYLEYISAPDSLRPEMTKAYENVIEEFINAEPYNEDPEVAKSQKEFQATLKKEYEEYKKTGSTKVFDSKTLLALDYLSLEPYSTPEEMYAFAELLDDTANWFTDLGMDWKNIGGIVGYTWPRWTSPKVGFQGKGYFDLFEKVKEDKKYPIEIMTETAGKELIVEDGKVVGVIAESRDKEYHIRSEKGVVLATGGFAANSEMVNEYGKEYWGELLTPEMPTTNISGTTGDGIKMAEKVDAMLEMMEDIMLFPNADPKTSSTENVVGDDGDMLSVNKNGVRFIDETLDRYSLSGAILEQPDQIHYIISDQANSKITDGKTFNGFDVEKMIKKGSLYRADTLEDLAKQLGMDPKVFVETVNKYNDAAENGNDEFGRTSFSANAKVDQAPFYACPRGVAAHITGGGLIRDEFYRVINNKGEVIEGLYAGGEVTAYMSGISSFGDGMYIGQIIFGKE